MIDKEWLLLDLEKVSDRTRWCSACGAGGGYGVKAMALGDEVYETFKRSPFAWMGEDWYCFNGQYYEPVYEELLEWALNELLRRMCVDIGVRSRFPILAKRAKIAVKMERVLKPSFHIRAFRNGVVDMTRGEVMPFEQKYDIVYQYDYDYDPKADCPMWKSFLRQVLPEATSRKILQMFLGLTTLDRNALGERVEVCLAMYGESSNGKDVVTDVVRGVLGHSNVSTVDVESIIGDGGHCLRRRSMLLGKILNISNDIKLKEVVGREGALMSYLGGSPLSARFLRGNEFTLPVTPWQMFNFTRIPTTFDDNFGFFKRFLYVMFQRYIADDQRNVHLSEELREEYPGILNWMIQGGRYAKLHGFRFPCSEASEKERLFAIGEQDVVFAWLLFLRLSYMPRVGGEEFRWIPTYVLYGSLTKFAEVNGFKAPTIQSFGRRMSQHGFRIQNRRRMANGFEYKIYGFTESMEHCAPVSIENWSLRADSEFDDVPVE